MRRAAENCTLYPACYWAGDCNHDHWREADCGLPRAEQVKRRDKWMADLALRIERNRLAARLAAEARAGKHDHLLAQGIEAQRAETPKSGSVRSTKARSRSDAPKGQTNSPPPRSDGEGNPPSMNHGD